MSHCQEDSIVWDAVNQARRCWTWSGYIAMLDYYLRNHLDRAAEKEKP
jgi:hypothetical protein